MAKENRHSFEPLQLMPSSAASEKSFPKGGHTSSIMSSTQLYLLRAAVPYLPRSKAMSPSSFSYLFSFSQTQYHHSHGSSPAENERMTLTLSPYGSPNPTWTSCPRGVPMSSRGRHRSSPCFSPWLSSMRNGPSEKNNGNG